MEDYQEFLARKQNIAPLVGFDPGDTLPKTLKPFQRDIVRWGLRRGRAAFFEGTGLGKTLQQLSWAQSVAEHTQGRILLFAPLGVARQTVQDEGPKWGFNSICYAENYDQANADIVVTNYERLNQFDPSDFAGVILDESGIIKDATGKTRIDYRPVHLNTLTNEVESIPPKARTY